MPTYKAPELPDDLWIGTVRGDHQLYALRSESWVIGFLKKSDKNHPRRAWCVRKGGRNLTFPTEVRVVEPEPYLERVNQAMPEDDMEQVDEDPSEPPQSLPKPTERESGGGIRKKLSRAPVDAPLAPPGHPDHVPPSRE